MRHRHGFTIAIDSLALLASCATLRAADVFSYSGAAQSYVVPAGVTSITVKAWGAGGGGNFLGAGGAGGFTTGTLFTAPGETLTIIVGGGGQVLSGPSGGSGGFGGGGDGGDGTFGRGVLPVLGGSGGGGRSAILRASTELLTASGGGGASGSAGHNAFGGAGGGPVGQNGGAGSHANGNGKGGTQTAGGAGGSGGGGAGAPGTSASGGNGGTPGTVGTGGGGGGGGNFGGGGGEGNEVDGGGGGGGSSRTPASGSTIAGNLAAAPNTGDSDYLAGIAIGGGASFTTPAPGGNGRVVIIPDFADCNHNGIPDPGDIANCTPGDSECADCNDNGIPDGCETGQSLLLDGIDDLARVESPAMLPVGNAPRTIEAWIYRADASNEQAIFTYGTPANGQMCGLILSGNCPNKLYFYGHNADACSAHNVPIGAWTHVAVTWDGSSIKLYMNSILEFTGVPVPNTPLNTVLNANGLTFGARPDSPTIRWNGRIDEVRVWNVARTQPQILASMSVRLSGNEPNLIGYWNFEESNGQVIFDRSVSGQHGTLGADISTAADDPARSFAAAPLTGEFDCNTNGIPDACETDCNANGVPDDCELSAVPVAMAKLVGADTTVGDFFGNGVAVDGDTVVIGAPTDDDAGFGSGSAYVFVRIDGLWTQQAKLTASDAAAGDNFGISVSIEGDTVIVGAFFDANEAGSGAGAAYVFIRSGSVWTQQAKLIGTDTATGDRFGYSVSLSGEAAVISAPLDNDAGSDSGSAYIFIRDNGIWSEQTKLTADDAAAGDQFGISASIDRNTVVIGANLRDDVGDRSGAAYIFERSGSVWSQQAKLTASDAADGDEFGYSVSISGGTALVGQRYGDFAGSNSGAAYVFARSGISWAEQAKLTASDASAGDEFGISVTIRGKVAVIGAPFNDDAGLSSGSVYVFVRTGSVWQEQGRLLAADGAADDDCGFAVALDGDTVIAGAILDDHAGGLSAGSAYLFALVGDDCNANEIPDDCERGDMDGDQIVTLADVAPFVAKLLDADPVCMNLADMNLNGFADGDDIAAFIDALLAP